MWEHLSKPGFIVHDTNYLPGYLYRCYYDEQIFSKLKLYIFLVKNIFSDVTEQFLQYKDRMR